LIALLLATAGAAAGAAPVPPAAPVVEAEEKAPRPALWLLADEDTEIYLFGTIHILPPGFKWRSAALDRVVEQADELVVETYGGPEEALPEAALDMFLLDEPSPILERVPADRREALKAAIEAGPLPVGTYDAMETWAAAMILGLAQLLGDYQVDSADDAPGVEDVLEAAFRDAGKPIGSVEDPVAVLASLSGLPADLQSELLLQAIEGAAEERPEVDPELGAWIAGDAEEMEVSEADGLPAPLYEVLLPRRNAAWVRWLKARLERPGVVLFAVGAAHLAGPDSVQRMLADQGMVARRVD